MAQATLPKNKLWQILGLNCFFFILPLAIQLINPIATILDFHVRTGIMTKAISAIYLPSLYFIPLVNFFATLYLSTDELENENISNGAIYRRSLTVAFFSFYIYIIALRVIADGERAIDTSVLDLVNPIMMFIITFYFGGGITKDIFNMTKTNSSAKPDIQALAIDTMIQKSEVINDSLKQACSSNN